ncbi:transglycosylase SLT domain-containing protein [Oceaniglobus ichthyenteri]|uniref:transglycosylase SLT domain-containing protein n=1 Tax=Oceaniglobus ichthyenteri TaxID=2136177 RepID=UPI001F0C8D66|nr:transglycosylase SLT domain-containing protein [Oceaniglobus ichthyenteri]
MAGPERSLRPMPRPAFTPEFIPQTRWDHRGESDVWTRAALGALKSHGAPLADIVPRDIGQWCPGYPTASKPVRRAFWVGLLSALAKHESTWKPKAVGGGGRWYGLLQILPATARGYGCKARTGGALQSGPANLACAIRILSVTVPRDGVVHAQSPRWGGVAADWGPMRSATKRQDMANWLRSQAYCQINSSPRPMPRPGRQIALK